MSVGADLGVATTGTSTDPTSGTYSGRSNIPAGDNGLLTYSVGTGPSSKGSVVVNSDGTFTYTPTAAARHQAAADDATTAQKTTASPSSARTQRPVDHGGYSAVTLSTTNAAPTGPSRSPFPAPAALLRA